MDSRIFYAGNKIKREHLFGRKVYYTNVEKITKENVVQVLSAALVYHNFNRADIDYLERYHNGDQPILYRHKEVRPEICNKVVENFAYDAVGFHTSQDFGEPIKYTSADADGEDLSEQINQLNRYMRMENKEYWDIELGTWQNICGTSYRFILPDSDADLDDDEAPFTLDVLDPRYAFCVYSSRIGKKSIMGVRIIVEDDGQYVYECYTKNQRFTITNGEVTGVKINPIGKIPIIEYPKNSRRIGIIELTITLTDAINTMQSNRLDGIEQFVQAFMKFVNCEIDKDKFLEMCQLGAIKIKGEPGLPADVDMVSSQLDQSNSQVAKDDLYKSFLIIQGMPSREQNTGGDTGSAVYLRNGWDFAEKRTEKDEPIIKLAEREFLKIAIHILNRKTDFDLKPSDVEIQIVRNKTDNMLVKAQALQILLASGVDEEIAISIVELFSDPQKVYAKSKDRMDALYDKSSQQEETAVTDNVTDQTTDQNVPAADTTGGGNSTDGKTNKPDQATVN